MGTGPARLIPTVAVSEARGTLIAAEQFTHVPFDIARIFLVSDVPAGELRGAHAHFRGEQFLICVSGSIDAVADDGETRTVYHLDSPTQGLYLPAFTWGGQLNHSPDAVLLVLASEPYDDADYIHDYDEFSALLAERRASA